MMEKKLGFIGTGNMGAALIKGVLKAGFVRPEYIYAFDIDREKTDILKKESCVNTPERMEDAVENSSVIVLAVKPNMVKPALEELKLRFGKEKVLVSVAAGISIKTIKDVLGSDAKVIRAMPNTPALVGEGITLISHDGSICGQDIELVRSLFECVGKVEMLDEKLMNEVIALTSSSPAYVFMFIEAMADAAVLSGIPRNIAYKLAAQAVLGSARMMLETGRHPGTLKDEVCSPGGTTIEAVKALEKNGFRYAVMEAMSECTKKAREISR